MVQKRQEEQLKAKREATVTEASRRAELEKEKEKLPDITMEHTERAPFINDIADEVFDNDVETPDDKQSEQELRDTGG